MKAKIFLSLVFLLVLGMNGCGFIAKKYTKTETTTHNISVVNKKSVSLKNVHGNVMISQNSDSNMMTIRAFKEIKVKKKYRDTPFDEIEIEIDTSSDIISISTEINQKGSDKLFNFGRNQRVDYEIYLPPNIDIEIDNVNGNISSSGARNNLNISLINGDVDLSYYTGRIECEITNGAFSGKIDSTSGIYVNTINGGITLFLNNYINANIFAESINSRITDENLQLRDLMKEKKLLRGKIGNTNTDVDIKIESINGKIKLFGRNEI